jgi:hypothetical protein
VFLSFSLATNLKQAGKNASSTCSWWSKAKIKLNSSAVSDIKLLLEMLRRNQSGLDPLLSSFLPLPLTGLNQMQAMQELAVGPIALELL